MLPCSLLSQFPIHRSLLCSSPLSFVFPGESKQTVIKPPDSQAQEAMRALYVVSTWLPWSHQVKHVHHSSIIPLRPSHNYPRNRKSRAMAWLISTSGNTPLPPPRQARYHQMVDPTSKRISSQVCVGNELFQVTSCVASLYPAVFVSALASLVHTIFRVGIIIVERELVRISICSLL